MAMRAIKIMCFFWRFRAYQKLNKVCCGDVLPLRARIIWLRLTRNLTLLRAQLRKMCAARAKRVRFLGRTKEPRLLAQADRLTLYLPQRNFKIGFFFSLNGVRPLIWKVLLKWVHCCCIWENLAAANCLIALQSLLDYIPFNYDLKT